MSRVAIVGAGWAGLAAAVAAVEAGHAVTVLEMAPQPGGRARSLAAEGAAGGDPADRLDNGQHILIGAYTATLGLMRRVGVDPDAVLRRQPLALLDQDGVGLRLRAGSPLLEFGRAVWAMRHWRLSERLALSSAALGWLLRGFRCDAGWTVAQLTAGLPARVRAEILDPLCVAALNTPAPEASAPVFLRVLHDALFSGPGASDLLIPRRPLAELLPEPAWRWLQQHGATLHTGRRVRTLEPEPAPGGGWRVDGEVFDQVVLACPPAEAARLTRAVAPGWAAQAEAFGFEPIITGYVQAPGARLAAPMVALAEGPQAPAQFAFDHGALGLRAGRFAFVVSGAAPWVERGLEATGQALLAQARAVLRDLGEGEPAVRLERLVAEKRATFRCVPGLVRPPAQIAPGLRAAADWIEGPYPATLEGAVRSALAR